MKKIFSFIFLFTLVFITSCGSNQQINTYNIIYNVEGNIVEHNPSTYQEGKVTNLTPLNNEDFLGWYDNSAFIGEAITYIGENRVGDIYLYAKISKSQEEKSLQEFTRNITSFKYDLAIKSTEYDTITSSAEYMNKNYKFATILNNETYYDYLEYKNNAYAYYSLDEQGNYYTISDSDPYFKYYVASYYRLDLDKLNASDFIYQNSSFVLKDKTNATSIMEEVVKVSLNERQEICDNITIKVAQNEISSIVFENKSIENSFQKTTYEFVLSNINKTSFSIPVATTLETTMPIKDVYNVDDNESVSITGVVVGIVGNNIYLQDETKAVYVYFGSTNEYLSQIEFGQVLTICGTKTTYKGLVEIQDLTTVEVGKKTEPTAQVLENVSQNLLDEYQSSLVTTKNLTVKSIGEISQTQDVKIVLSDGVNDVTLFISKHLDDATKQNIISTINTLDLMSVVKLTNVVVGYYNIPQLNITQNSTITVINEVVDLGLSLNQTFLQVDLNTSFDDAIKNLQITLLKSDNTKQEILKSDCSFIHSYDKTKEGKYLVTIKYNNLQTTFTISSIKNDLPNKASEDTLKLIDIIDQMGYDEETKTTYGVNRGLPSIGNPKVLVIPVAFSNIETPKNMQETLRQAFFASSEVTGWESLASYYQKASYGKLNITGDVLPVYNTNKTSTYYDSIENGEYEIIKAALSFYDATVNYQDYDSDSDGYIDAIYLVYTAPIDYYSSSSMYWAFTYEYLTDDYEYYDSVEADFYAFIGYDFLFEEHSSETTLTYNLETFIHETGHLLGLDDYYDIEPSIGTTGGVGGGVMMDANVGDHDPFSKAILGWASPYIVSSTTTITLKSFEKTGDFVLIPKNFNGSYFTEYYLIDFYTPTGLNEMASGTSGLFSDYGIRIFHIDATLANPKNVWDIWSVYESNNSSTNHRLIELVEADRLGNIDNNEYSSNSDLFKENDSFTWATWYNGSNANFSVFVSSITNENATITIIF